MVIKQKEKKREEKAIREREILEFCADCGS